MLQINLHTVVKKVIQTCPEAQAHNVHDYRRYQWCTGRYKYIQNVNKVL